MYDVAIVGGGPVGSYLALKLAQAGRSVIVLEKKPMAGGKTCCTGIVGVECLSQFPLDERLILRRISSASLFSPSGNVLRLKRKEPQAVVLDRSALDIVMSEKAQTAGAEYLFGSHVTQIDVSERNVTISNYSRRAALEAKVAVIASGFGGSLVSNLKFGRVSDYTVGAQAEVETDSVDEVEVYSGRQVAPGFFGWLVPTIGNRALVGLMSRRGARAYLEKLVTSLMSQGKIKSIIRPPSCAGISIRPLPRTFAERLLVVGEAAGQVKPTTGGGIYYGLLCAEIAAEHLHHALESGNLNRICLSAYERECKKKLGQEMKLGYYARKFYERLNDQQIDKIFDIMNRYGIREALLEAEDLSFDWHSRVALRFFSNAMMAKMLKMMRIPFRRRYFGNE